jgi:hypothetical protein
MTQLTELVRDVRDASVGAAPSDTAIVRALGDACDAMLREGIQRHIAPTWRDELVRRASAALRAGVALGVAWVALACAPTPQPRTYALPDTMYTASGGTVVVLAESLYVVGAPEQTVLGQLKFLERTVYVSRKVVDARMARRVLEHERCHMVLLESGMWRALTPNVTEVVCDAFASAALSALERERRP